MAPMHSGFLEEYPLIRVDNFTATLPLLPATISPCSRDDLPSGSTHFSPPHISLLSHPHTDHLAGLCSLPKHSAPIYCSEVTKRLLLALEKKIDRQRFDNGQSSKKCPYRSLRKSQKESRVLEREAGTSSASSWDLLHPLPFNCPVVLPYTARTSIRLTLLSANHMPGSTMFLIEGERGAVLHTGDMRAEHHFIQALVARSHLCRLHLQHLHFSSVVGVTSRHQFGSHESQPQLFQPTPRLCNIYLDTERLLDGGVPLTKSEAILDVLQLLRLFPTSARVHIACWTSGYEEFLLSLANVYPREEGGYIHLDRYKQGLFQIMALDPDFEGLNELASTDKTKCGRFCACDTAACIQSSDVRIETHESMDVDRWKIVKEDLLDQITAARHGKGDWPRVLPLPLQRHSPLMEIYGLIKQLQPMKVTANTAHCSARFVLAQISQRLQLCTGKEELQRQERLVGPYGKADKDDWSQCSKAWEQSSMPSEGQGSDADFFERVSRFRSLLRVRTRVEGDRIAKEKMDAEEGLATSDLDPSLSIPGPWSDQGRYAAVDASPFLTPAMRKAVAAKGGLSPEQQTTNRSGPVLTVELASRYLAYASMFLGWKIRNPSRYRPEVAWRAIRKLRPDLARKSEEALLIELGLAIPSWDEAEKEMISLPTTPSLLPSKTEKLPSTPTGRTRPLSESISPLQLGAAALLRRLDEEAASQELNSSSIIDGQEGEVELVRIDGSAVTTGTTFAIDDFAGLEHQMRRSRRTRIWSEGGTRGQQLFQLIVSEWQHSPSKHLDLARFSHQLNLVGAAVRSKRGRTILSWESANFQEAYRALKTIYSTTKARLPIRGRNVLRYLQDEIRTSAHRGAS